MIRILEFLDSIGVTRRDGDRRKVRPDYFLIVGPASPYQRSLDRPVRSTAP
ncbi:SelB domain-containing protein [Peristeroidobacter agariperforans]|uniref:SelB domain-containing protein n=1 Tax=Peristeroidobacter agariperforans TaxID=268404 RepID=UPI0018E57F2C